MTDAGGYTAGHMAALGATLGILLFIALVVIGVLLYKMRRRNTDWRKLYEASVFRSSVSSHPYRLHIEFKRQQVLSKGKSREQKKLNRADASLIKRVSSHHLAVDIYESMIKNPG